MIPPRENSRWVLIARILRPRGNKGEVSAELFTDFPERLTSRTHLYIGQETQEPRKIGLSKFWVDRNHPGFGVFHFESVTSIDAAEKLRGLSVWLPVEDRVQLPAGRYFVSDLIGCTVFEIPSGQTQSDLPASAMEEAPRAVGSVKDVFFPGEGVAGTPLLQVETSAGELLVPLAEDICRRVDVAAKRIDVTLPEGLQELNAPE